MTNSERIKKKNLKVQAPEIPLASPQSTHDPIVPGGGQLFLYSEFFIFFLVELS